MRFSHAAVERAGVIVIVWLLVLTLILGKRSFKDMGRQKRSRNRFTPSSSLVVRACVALRFLSLKRSNEALDELCLKTPTSITRLSLAYSGLTDKMHFLPAIRTRPSVCGALSCGKRGREESISLEKAYIVQSLQQNHCNQCVETP